MTLIDFVFPKLRLPETRSYKFPVSEDASASSMETCRSSVKISITAHLPYSLITSKSIELETVSLIDMANVGTVS